MGNAGVTQSPSKTAQSPGENFLQWCLLPFLAFDEGWVLIFDLYSLLGLYRVLVSGRRGDALEVVRSTSAYAGMVCCTTHLLAFVLVPGQARGWQALMGKSLFWPEVLWQRARELSLRKFQTAGTLG